MNIEKRYWQWTEDLNDTEFKLGVNIQELIDKGLVKTSSNLQQYKGADGFPWIIDVDDENKIASVCYREKFLSIKGECIANLNSREFISKMKALLKSTDETHKGDRLSVVFRDSFLGILVINRTKMSG